MPVASFRISIAASVMTLPEGSTTTPLMVASVDWARTNGGAQRINNSRRRAQRYFKRRLLKQTGKWCVIRFTEAPCLFVSAIFVRCLATCRERQNITYGYGQGG